MPVGPAHQDRQRQSARIGQDIALAAELTQSVGLGPVSWLPGARDACAIDARPAPIDLVLLAQPMKQCLMKAIPNPYALPLPQAPSTSHATAEAELLRQIFPRDAGHGRKVCR